MNDTDAELERLRNAYRSAADIWVAAIPIEEQLAPVNRTVAQVGTRETAQLVADGRRDAEAAKAAYEAALRSRFFDIG
jgi:hypothetical protein